MARTRRWDPCVAHRDADVDTFITDYFTCPERPVLFVAGAGFDPRATAVATRLAAASKSARAIFVRENRPDPEQGLVLRADTNIQGLLSVFANGQVVPIDIFSGDGAVIGGRSLISILGRLNLDGITDVVIDISALSVGISFPLIKYFVYLIENGKGPVNLHVFIAHDPKLDADIRSVPSDAPGYVHTFQGRANLDSSAMAARLWLPQLAAGRRHVLGRLHAFVKPDDTCPILPFPSTNPRLADALAEEYLQELESGWSVDTRNIVYADEGDPLDLYRTILRLDDLRKPVFAETGGSLLVLSPLGSKVMALGALLAALERDLPVAHLEPIGYTLGPSVPRGIAKPDLIHIWLEGDVYPQPRSALLTDGRPL